MKITIRKSVSSDIDFLEELEKKCFPLFQQSNRRAIRYSLSSPFQNVIVAEITQNKITKAVGSATLFLYPKTLRLFSVAVFPEYQGIGIGKQILEYILNFANTGKFERISLEARKADKKLIEFYKNTGFTITEELPDYYSKNEDGVRMVFKLEDHQEKQSISNIIIVRDPKSWNLEIEGVKVISSRNYITDPEFQSLKNVRIFNLSNSYQYQKMGYYVSLLASARDHRVIPNVTTLRDFSSLSLIRSISGYVDDNIQKSLKQVKENKVSLYIYFGQSVNPKYRLLAQKLYHCLKLLCYKSTL